VSLSFLSRTLLSEKSRKFIVCSVDPLQSLGSESECRRISRIWLRHLMEYRGVDPGGWGSGPLKICRGSEYVLTPWKCHILSFLLLYSCKFHNIKDEQLEHYHFTDPVYADDDYHPYVWSAPSRQCPPINAFAAIGYLSWPKFVCLFASGLTALSAQICYIAP